MKDKDIQKIYNKAFHNKAFTDKELSLIKESGDRNLISLVNRRNLAEKDKQADISSQIAAYTHAKNPNAIKSAGIVKSKERASKARSQPGVRKLGFRKKMVTPDTTLSNTNFTKDLKFTTRELTKKVMPTVLKELDNTPELTLVKHGMRIIEEAAGQTIVDLLDERITEGKSASSAGGLRKFPLQSKAAIRKIISARLGTAGSNLENKDYDEWVAGVKTLIKKDPALYDKLDQPLLDSDANTFLRKNISVFGEKFTNKKGVEEYKINDQEMGAIMRQVRHMSSATHFGTEGLLKSANAHGHSPITEAETYLTGVAKEGFLINIARSLTKNSESGEIPTPTEMATMFATQFDIDQPTLEKMIPFERVEEYAKYSPDKMAAVVSKYDTIFGQFGSKMPSSPEDIRTVVSNTFTAINKKKMTSFAEPSMKPLSTKELYKKFYPDKVAEDLDSYKKVKKDFSPTYQNNISKLDDMLSNKLARTGENKDVDEVKNAIDKRYAIYDKAISENIGYLNEFAQGNNRNLEEFEKNLATIDEIIEPHISGKPKYAASYMRYGLDKGGINEPILAPPEKVGKSWDKQSSIGENFNRYGRDINQAQDATTKSTLQDYQENRGKLMSRFTDMVAYYTAENPEVNEQYEEYREQFTNRFLKINGKMADSMDEVMSTVGIDALKIMNEEFVGKPLKINPPKSKKPIDYTDGVDYEVPNSTDWRDVLSEDKREKLAWWEHSNFQPIQSNNKIPRSQSQLSDWVNPITPNQPELNAAEININTKDAVVESDKMSWGKSISDMIVSRFTGLAPPPDEDMQEAMKRMPGTPGFNEDMYSGDPSKFYGASTEAMFTALDMAYIRQKNYAAGKYPSGQSLAADRGYRSIHEQKFTAQQYTLNLSKFDDNVRAKIGNAVRKAIEETMVPSGDAADSPMVASWGMAHKGDPAYEAIATGRLQIAASPEAKLTPDKLKELLQDENIGGLDPDEIRKLFAGSEQYESVGEMTREDIFKAKQFAQIEKTHSYVDKLSDTLNKVRHFSVELNMSMLGLMFSALSFIGIVTQGLGKLLQPLQDLQGTFKGIGIAMAFGGDNAKRFAKDIDPGALIQSWMDLQGVVAGVQSMMASLSTKLLDAGFFDRLDTAIGLLGDTLTEPQNLALFGNLIDKLVEAIPAAISGLEKALGVVSWINSIFEKFGLNLFGIIAAAGLFGTILLPVFAIINAAMQAIQFVFVGIILSMGKWIHQLLFAQPILKKLVGYTTAIKNNLTMAFAKMFGVMSSLFIISSMLGESGDTEENVNIKYAGQGEDGAVMDLWQWIGQNIMGIYMAAMLFSGVVAMIGVVKSLWAAFIPWYMAKTGITEAKDVTFKSMIVASLAAIAGQLSFQSVQDTLQTLHLSQILAHQISQGIAGGLPLIGAALGIIIGVLMAWWGWTQAQQQTTNITVSPDGSEVNVVQKLATGGDVQRGGLFQLHAGEAVINSAASSDMVERLENIEKNTGESAAGIGLLERAISYLGWFGLGDNKKSTSMASGGGGGIFDWIMGLVAGFGEWLGNIWSGIRDFLGVPEDVGFWGWLWDGIVAWLGNPLGGTVDYIGYMWGLVRKAFSVPENVSFFTYVWDTMKSWIGADNPVVKLVDLVVDKVKEWLGIEPSEALVPAIIGKIKEWVGDKPEGTNWATYILDTIIAALFGSKSPTKMMSGEEQYAERGTEKSFIDTILDRLVPDNLGSLFIDTLLDKLGVSSAGKNIGDAAGTGLTAGFMATIPPMGWLYSAIFGKHSWSPEELSAFAGIIPSMGFLYAALFGDGDEKAILGGISAVGKASGEFTTFMGQIPVEFANLNTAITAEMNNMVNRSGDGLAASLKAAETAYEDTTDGVVKALTNMTNETDRQMTLFVGYVEAAISKAVAAAARAAGANYNDSSLE